VGGEGGSSGAALGDVDEGVADAGDEDTGRDAARDAGAHLRLEGECHPEVLLDQPPHVLPVRRQSPHEDLDVLLRAEGHEEEGEGLVGVVHGAPRAQLVQQPLGRQRPHVLRRQLRRRHRRRVRDDLLGHEDVALVGRLGHQRDPVAGGESGLLAAEVVDGDEHVREQLQQQPLGPAHEARRQVGGHLGAVGDAADAGDLPLPHQVDRLQLPHGGAGEHHAPAPERSGAAPYDLKGGLHPEAAQEGEGDRADGVHPDVRLEVGHPDQRRLRRVLGEGGEAAEDLEPVAQPALGGALVGDLPADDEPRPVQQLRPRPADLHPAPVRDAVDELEEVPLVGLEPEAEARGADARHLQRPPAQRRQDQVLPQEPGARLPHGALVRHGGGGAVGVPEKK